MCFVCIEPLEHNDAGIKNAISQSVDGANGKESRHLIGVRWRCSDSENSRNCAYIKTLTISQLYLNGKKARKWKALKAKRTTPIANIESIMYYLSAFYDPHNVCVCVCANISNIHVILSLEQNRVRNDSSHFVCAFRSFLKLPKKRLMATWAKTKLFFLRTILHTHTHTTKKKQENVFYYGY